MAIAFIHPLGNTDVWLNYFQELDPELEVQAWPNIDYGKNFEMAVLWNHPAGELKKLNGLRCVSSLGAGVEHILMDPDLPKNVTVTRVVDPGLMRQMTEYVTMMTLVEKRGLLKQLRYQRERRWVKDVDYNQDCDRTVGIMGLGELGRDSAEALVRLRFPVTGWSRTEKIIPGVTCFHGDDQRDAFLQRTEILVCILPLTPSTENILSTQLFEKLPKGAFVINVGRGRQLVEQDLLAALDSGQLSGACLDVFREEPLPQSHPFWAHPKITVTCHVSSITDPRRVARFLAETHRRLMRGSELLHVADISRGY